MTVLDATAIQWMAQFTDGASLGDVDPSTLSIDLRLELVNIKERRVAMAQRQYWTDLIGARIAGYESELAKLRDLEVRQRKKKRKVLSTTYDLSAWEVSEETQFPSGTKEIIDACDKQLKRWRTELDRATYPWTTLQGGELVTATEPLFDKQQIGEVLYSPLVRRVLFPDGLVPSDYSDIAKNLTGSLEAYMGNEDLVYSEAEAAKEAAKVIGGLVKAMADVAGAGGGLADTMGTISEESLHTLQTVVLVTKAVTDLAVTGVEVIPQGKKGVGTGLDKAFSVVGATVASSMKIWDPTGDSLGSMVPTIVDAGCKAAGRLSKGIADTMTSETTSSAADAMIEMIGEQIAIGFSVAGSASSDDNLKVLFATLSRGVGKVANPKLRKSLARAIQSGDGKDWAAFATGLAGAVSDVIATGVTTHMSVQLANKLDPDKNEDYKTTDEYTKWLASAGAGGWNEDKQLEGWNHYRADLLNGKSDSDGSLIDTLSEQIQSVSEAIAGDPAVKGAVLGLQSREKSFQEREESFEAELAGGGGSRAIREAMARIKQHEMVINLVTGVMKGGAAAAGLFFPAAQAAGTLADLIKTTDHLIADIRAVVAFRQSKTWAENANSHFVLPLKAFLDNEAHLIARDISHMLLQFVIMGAKVATAAGHPIVVASAKVVDASASMLDATVDVVAWAVDLSVAKKAWEATEAALLDPGNRRLSLRAMRMNVTLGKYALAYGATVQRHPVARQIVARVGDLTPEDLMVEGNKRAELCEELFGLLQSKYDRHVQVKTRMLEDNPPEPTWADKIILSVEPARWSQLKLQLTQHKLEADLSPVVRIADAFRRDRVDVRDRVNETLEELLANRERLAKMEQTRQEAALRQQRKTLMVLKSDIIQFKATCAQLEAGLAAVNRNIKAACASKKNTAGETLDEEVLRANIRAGNFLGDKIVVVQEDAVIARDLAQDHEDLIDRRLDYLLAREAKSLQEAFDDMDDEDIKQAVAKVKRLLDT